MDPRDLSGIKMAENGIIKEEDRVGKRLANIAEDGYLEPSNMDPNPKSPKPGIASDSVAAGSPESPNDYEELPGNRYNYAEPTDAPMPPMFTKLVSSGSSSSEQLFRSQPFYRKRENPLYESGEKEVTAAAPPPSGPPSCGSCLCITLVLISVFAVTALILTLLIISGKLQPTGDPAGPKYAKLISPMNSSQLEATLLRISQLEEKYSALEREVERLQNSATVDDLQAVQRNVSANGITLNQAVGNISVIDQKLSEYASYHQTVNQSLDDLDRRMVDLGACDVKAITTITRSGLTESIYNVATLNQSSVVLGVTCAAENGKTANFLTSPDNTMYKCACREMISSNQDMKCVMYIWYCPRV